MIAYAHNNNRRFRDPLPDAEVRNIGVQVARHTWDNRDQFTAGAGYTPEQRSRGGKRRAVQVHAANYDRDSAIRADYLSYMDQAAIGRKHGLTPSAVHKIIGRMFAAGIV